LSTDRLELT